MRRLLAPTIGATAVPIGLVVLSLMPSVILRMSLFAILAYPHVWIAGHPPFPYHDKPWYVSPQGAVVIAIEWAVAIYVMTCLLRNVRLGDKALNKSPETTRGK